MTSPTRDQTNHNVRLNALSIPASLISTTINIKMGSIGGHSFKLLETVDCGENIHERSSDFTFGNLSSTTANIWINFVLFSGENEVEFTFTPESVSGLSAHTCTVLSTTKQLDFEVTENGTGDCSFTVNAAKETNIHGSENSSGAATPESTGSAGSLSKEDGAGPGSGPSSLHNSGRNSLTGDEAPETIGTGSNHVIDEEEAALTDGSGSGRSSHHSSGRNSLTGDEAPETIGTGSNHVIDDEEVDGTGNNEELDQISGTGSKGSIHNSSRRGSLTGDDTSTSQTTGTGDANNQERREETCFERVASFAFSSLGTIRTIVGV